MAHTPVPCSVYNNQTQLDLSSDWLGDIPLWIEQYVWPEVTKHQLSNSVFNDLDFLEISFIDDTMISQAHADFMNDPTPTDVITFLHGELLISVETASRQANEHQQKLETELSRYIVHGILHLAGYTDYEALEQQTMLQLQELILKETLPHFS